MSVLARSVAGVLMAAVAVSGVYGLHAIDKACMAEQKNNFYDLPKPGRHSRRSVYDRIRDGEARRRASDHRGTDNPGIGSGRD